MQKARRHTFPPEGEHSAPTACRHTVSGTISLPLQGCFSPFPHGTGSLSVVGEYLALEGGPPGFRRDYSCPVLLRNRPGGSSFSLTGLSPSMARLSSSLRLTSILPLWPSYNPTHPERWVVWAISRSLALLRKSRLISLPQATEIFHFAWLAPTAYGFSSG